MLTLGKMFWMISDAMIIGNDIIAMSTRCLYYKNLCNDVRSPGLGAPSMSKLFSEQMLTTCFFWIWVSSMAEYWANNPSVPRHNGRLSVIFTSFIFSFMNDFSNNKPQNTILPYFEGVPKRCVDVKSCGASGNLLGKKVSLAYILWQHWSSFLMTQFKGFNRITNWPADGSKLSWWW